MWYINGYGVNVTSAAALDIGEQSMIRAHTKETVKIQAQMRTFTKSSWFETVLIHVGNKVKKIFNGSGWKGY